MNSYKIRIVLLQGLQGLGSISIAMVFLITLTACTSQAAREAELAAIDAEREAQLENTASDIEQERQRAMQEQRRREAEDRVRIAAAQQLREESLAREEALAREETRARQEAFAREEELARAEKERRRREEAEQREYERLALNAAAEAERQSKLELIAELEVQIASIESTTMQDESTAAILRAAIMVAEELLDTLATEQAKYESTDEYGNTLEPLAKELIAELEARKDSLVRQAQ